jgi:serine protease Do
VTRGYLGMVPRELSGEMKKALSLDAAVAGVFVDSVQEDGPAAAGDLQAGDVVQEWNGRPVTDVADFRMQVAQTAPGEKVKARILRDGDAKTLTFVLTDRSLALKDTGVRPGAKPDVVEPDRLGLEVAQVDDNHVRRFNLDEALVKRNGGVVITGIQGDSPARGQLNVGDVIFRLDKTPVRNLKEFSAAEKDLAKDKSALLVHIIRGKRTTIEAIDLGD